MSLLYVVDHWLVPGLEFLADWSIRWGLLLAVLLSWLALLPPRRAATRYGVGIVLLASGLARCPGRCSRLLRFCARVISGSSNAARLEHALNISWRTTWRAQFHLRPAGIFLSSESQPSRSRGAGGIGVRLVAPQAKKVDEPVNPAVAAEGAPVPDRR